MFCFRTVQQEVSCITLYVCFYVYISAGEVNKSTFQNEHGLDELSNVLSLSQGVHEAGGPSLEYYHLERLVETVVSPYLGNVLHNTGQLQSGERQKKRPLTP